ncbi:MAG: DUF177 domain-containing protein [Lentisphaeria bacterium]
MKHQTLLQIQLKNLPPEGLRIAGAVDAATVLDIAHDDRATIVTPVELELHVTKAPGGVLVEGQASWTMRNRCDRCLAYYTARVEGLPLAYAFPDFTEDILDLTEAVRDDILLAFPTQSLCAAGCRGLCPECGQNLNVRDCGCRQEGAGDSAWSALDGLRLDGGPAEEADKHPK